MKTSQNGSNCWNLLTVLLSALVLVSFSACGSGSSSEVTTETPAIGTKIVNGVVIPPSTEEPVVRVVSAHEDGTIGVCSGTFISEHHVLTAAHCLITNTGAQRDPSQLGILTSTGDFMEATGVAIYTLYGTAVFRIPDVPVLGFHPYDLGIVLVDKRFEGTPIPLALSAPVPSEQIVMLGYGQTNTGIDGGGLLRLGVSTVDAVYYDQGILLHVFDSPLESNTCFGDSGGPILVQDGPEGQFSIVGVTSEGYFGRCEALTASVVTLVSHPFFLDWVTLVTGGTHFVY